MKPLEVVADIKVHIPSSGVVLISLLGNTFAEWTKSKLSVK